MAQKQLEKEQTINDYDADTNKEHNKRNMDKLKKALLQKMGQKFVKKIADPKDI